jgi:hypothetical protein
MRTRRPKCPRAPIRRSRYRLADHSHQVRLGRVGHRRCSFGEVVDWRSSRASPTRPLRRPAHPGVGARPYRAASTTTGRSTRGAWPRAERAGLTGRERRRTDRTRFPRGAATARRQSGTAHRAPDHSLDRTLDHSPAHEQWRAELGDELVSSVGAAPDRPDRSRSRCDRFPMQRRYSYADVEQKSAVRSNYPKAASSIMASADPSQATSTRRPAQRKQGERPALMTSRRIGWPGHMDRFQACSSRRDRRHRGATCCRRSRHARASQTTEYWPRVCGLVTPSPQDQVGRRRQDDRRARMAT